MKQRSEPEMRPPGNIEIALTATEPEITPSPPPAGLPKPESEMTAESAPPPPPPAESPKPEPREPERRPETPVFQKLDKPAAPSSSPKPASPRPKSASVSEPPHEPAGASPSGPTADTPAAARQGGGDPVASWEALVSIYLRRFKHYPELARMRHEVGIVILRLAMDRQGSVLTARIEKRSGSPLLDEEALALVHRAEPLPRPPPEVAGERIELVVPVKFLLD